MSKSISVVFFFFVLLYMVSLQYVLDFLWLLKIIPIAILGVGVFKLESSSTRTILLLALVFSGCGDLLLAFDEFIFGVAAFLLAQLSYAVLFRHYWQGFQRRWPLCVLLIMYMLIMVWLLIPNLGNLQLPVIAYLLTIAAMGLLALHSSLPIRWAVLGAILFIISDSFIAINKFINPFPYESYWIMSTYYAAQFMLVSGFLTSVRQDEEA
ncbi:lysoplasmalogenase [Paraglaciecola sp. MB-3u-78]|uniref:lysoplasmalogenase n=1 Tax=Paraglaciecola sp. MB-3u-78 TaxID=2058332 RepID=UPI001E5B8B55|nr:lysoplasmalogenase [Paraglaciecola sp. MB-3u-78]